ncbi:MAG: hypothetical protein IPM34_05800 [Saprospiraceae bacterium]|nr:hypothetical protein [Saprospiraceae bacterium]
MARYLIFSWFILGCTSLHTIYAQDTIQPTDREQLKTSAMRWIKSDPDRAISVFENWARRYHLFSQSGMEDLCHVFQAQAYIDIGRPEDASQLLNKLILQAEPFSKAMAYKTLANIDFRNGRFFSSTVKIRSAMELAKAQQEEELIAELQEDLALVFDKISKPDKAIQFYSRSLQLFTKLDKRPAMQKNALALGRIYLNLEKLDSAHYFIQQSLDLANQENLKTELFESKIELGNYYFLKNEFAKLENLVRDFETAEHRPVDHFLKVKFYVLKGKHAMAVNSEDQALQEFNKAEALSHQGFTPFIDYYIKSNLADAYYRKGNIAKAYELVKYLNHNSTSYSSKENQKLAESIVQSSEVNIRDREIDYLKIVNQLNEEKLKRELLMQENLRRENELKDLSLQQEQLLMNASQREKALQSEQLEKEKALNQSLLRENEWRQATIRDERQFQTFLWLGIVLLLILALVIFYLFRKQQEKNEIITKQSKDLEFVNKEVHHRVKNNLQVISSLLDLQSQYTQDKAYEGLLRESKHRVQSMAFIHQNLYESTGMNMVDMPNYIQNLIGHLVTAYQKDDEHVVVDVQVDPIHLHMDTVVSIGMIINELVTNSMKYAFVNRPDGRVKVSLQSVGEMFRLVVEDNGVGLPEPVHLASSTSFGYKMIRAFVQKLKGNISINREQGTHVSIEFKKR